MSSTDYKPQSIDTSVAADRLVFELLRKRSNCDRMEMSAALSRGAKELSLLGLKRTFNTLTASEFAQKVAFIWLGHQWPPGFEQKGEPMSWIQDSLQLARQLHPIFEQTEITYYITGGVAATAYGDPRTTRDLDVVISIERSQQNIQNLVSILEAAGFYVPGVEDIISGRLNTLQIIHQQTILQADLILSSAAEWETLKFQRRRLENGIYFISPEDIILSKLQWRQKSQSEKQWRDVLGVLKVQRERLDFDYLNQWANHLDLAEALDQCMREAGI